MLTRLFAYLLTYFLTYLFAVCVHTDGRRTWK